MSLSVQRADDWTGSVRFSDVSSKWLPVPGAVHEHIHGGTEECILELPKELSGSKGRPGTDRQGM